MGGSVYLRTNRFEVKLEGITFKTTVFEYLCIMDFLFPAGKVWDSPPIVGLDVMRHPRDPSVLLLFLCFGVGCVILRFLVGEPLPAPIHKFLADKRIHFVGFGIPEKKDLFPFEELGLTKNKVDIGYLAAKILKQPKCKNWELAELARKVLGIKRMTGLTEASSFERDEQIKCAICQLFITSVIAMRLLRANDDKKKSSFSPIKSSFLKNLNSLHLLAEEWFKLSKGKKKNEITQVEEEEDSVHVHIGEVEDPFIDSLIDVKIQEDDPKDEYSSGAEDKEVDLGHGVEYDKDKEQISSDGSKDVPATTKMPLKGILKCPSTGLQSCNLFPSEPSTPRGALKRANSKRCNVSFKCE